MPDRNLYNPIIAKKDLTLEDLFIMCFCIIDDQYKLLFGSPKYWRNSNNCTPEFTDTEVLTIGLVKELCRINSFQNWQRMAANNYSHLFPKLISRSRLCRRLKGLLRAMEIIRQNLLFLLNADLTSIRIVDSFPLPLCHLKRLARSTCPFEYLANVGRCESKGETYYGVKVHIMATLSGIPVGYCITPASTHDTKGLIALLADTPNLLGITLLGDKGYVGKELHALVLQRFGVTMLVQQRCYDKELPESAANALIRKNRHIVETTISLLSVAMHAGQNLTRSVTGLMLQLKTKFTAFNLANYLNVLLGEPVLQVASF